MPNPKKLFFITLALLIVSGAALFVYNFFIQEQTAPAEQNNQPSPENFDLKPKIILRERVLAPTISQDNQTIKYYLATNGHVFVSDFDGQNLNEISTVDLPGISEIVWSPDKTKVADFTQNQSGAMQPSVFDYTTKRFFSLNPNIKNIVWSPNSQKIAYQFQSSNGSTEISIANPDGSNWKNISKTRLKNFKISWPSPDKISLVSDLGGKEPGSLIIINPETGDLTTLLNNIYGLAVNWSPDGQKFIFQQTDQNGKNLKLYLGRVDGAQAPKELPVQTLAKKCVWASDSQTIYCAVPQKLSSNAIWPDDYLAGHLVVDDDFYLIDTSTAKKTGLTQLDKTDISVDGQNLFLSPLEDYLFFINQKNGWLYNIKLK